MKVNIQLFVFLVLLATFGKIRGQSRELDSLRRQLTNAKSDSVRVNAYLDLGNYFSYLNHDTALRYYHRSLALCELLLKDPRLQDTRLKHNKRRYGTALYNIGRTESGRGNIAVTLAYYGRCLKVREEIDDKIGLTALLVNIGIIHNQQTDTAMAMQYFRRGLQIAIDSDNKKGQALAYTNIGVIFDERNDYQKAIEYYEKSLKIRESIDDRKGMANSLVNMGGIYVYQKKFGKALEYLRKGLAIREELGVASGIGACLNSIGNVYTLQGNYAKALAYHQRCFELEKKGGYPQMMMVAAHGMMEDYNGLKNYREALRYFELEIQLKDSLANESTRKAAIKSQLKYEYEKQAAADSVAHAKASEIKSAELRRQSAELKAKKNQQYALFGGLALVMIFAGFMYNRFKITQKQKRTIEHQKDEVEEQKKLVEEKQKEVLDSIQYARRIQLAQIPSEKRIAAIFKKLNRQ